MKVRVSAVEHIACCKESLLVVSLVVACHHLRPCSRIDCIFLRHRCPFEQLRIQRSHPESEEPCQIA